MAVGALAPLVSITLQARSGGLGANPIAEALNELGLTALILLVATLAMTPLRLVAGWTWPARIRRTLGLSAFGYAVVHFLTYAVLDQELALRRIVEDVAKRPFILVGAAALASLLPLALTSTAASVRRLGFVAWSRLHRLAYVAGGLGVIHFFLRVKKDVREPIAYALVLAALFAVRGVAVVRRRSVALPRADLLA